MIGKIEKGKKMKRSEVNQAITDAKLTLEKINFKLPVFGYWRTEKWREEKENVKMIIEVMQGWDVTDFGSGNFKDVGAVLFTIRNGNLYDTALGTPYAEKVIILSDETEQEIPMHFHNVKTEDIINRGGGILVLQLYNTTSTNEIDKASDVEVYRDGVKHVIKAGEIIEIEAGGSITLTPRLYHKFYAKRGCGNLVVGEVSTINDDNKDNIFEIQRKRFTGIEEDEPILYPLVNEYKEVLFKE